MSHIGLESPETPTESKIFLQTVEEVKRFKSFSFRSFGYATSGDALAFTLWNDGEPNNSGNDENCVNVNQDSDSYVQGKWNDWSCDNQARFVCEIATPSFEVKLKV